MTRDPTADVEAILPLAPMQTGMLLHSLAAPASGVYVTQVVMRLAGALREEQWRRAWCELGARHAALRASFLWHRRDEPIQIVHRDVDTPWQRVDWSQAGAAQPQALLEQRLREDRAQAFDPAQAPLFRHCLCHLDETHHVHLWTFHHILLDGWSSQLLIDEALARYAALGRGESLEMPEPPSLRAYLRWLRQQPREPLRAYWSTILGDVAAPTPLAFAGRSRSRPDAVQSDCIETELSLAQSTRLREAARDLGVTLGTVLNGAWGLVLACAAGADDVVFGMVHSGRQVALAGVTQTVGLLLNTVPLRVRFDWEQPLGDWLRGLQAEQMRALAHGHLPLHDIRKCAALPGDVSLFDSLLVLESAPELARNVVDGVEIEAIDYIDRTNVPLAVLVHPHERLLLRINFDGSRFERWGMERVLAALCAALENVPGAVGARLSHWSLLAPPPAPSAAADGAADTACVTEDIWRRAQERASQPAVTRGAHTLTYAELIRRAERGAAALRALGAGRGNAVGLCMAPSVEWVVAVLAVLRAGAAYVPIDPRLPPARVGAMLTDIATTWEGHHAALVITDESGSEFVAADLARAVPLSALEQGPLAETPATAVLEALAYVLFTSGSSGAPKGVRVSRRNLASSTRARLRHYREPVGRFLLLSPFGFDSSVAGLFWTLATGGELILPEGPLDRGLAELPGLIERSAVTHTLCLPSLYELILDSAGDGQLRSLATVIVAGEACPATLLDKHRQRCAQAALHNEYGPTEGTVWCTVYDVPADAAAPGERVPIGYPIDGMRVHIVDPRLRPLPRGFAGEICIAGPGVAEGYLNDAALTSERFVADPFCAGGRLYRTGDLGRRRGDGAIEFLGRRDDQVKVRGMRFHLGEVEAGLAAHPAVGQAAVVARTRGNGCELVAFVGGGEAAGVTPQEVREFLAARLPAPMVPAQVRVLGSLPRLANGKVDRRRLADFAETQPPRASADASRPADATQRAVAEVWAQTLGGDAPRLDESFFDSGGDSLSAAVLIRDVNRRLRTRLSVVDLYDAPTIAGLARRAASADAAEQWVRNVAIRPTGSRPPFFLAYGNARALAEHLDAALPVHWLIHGRAGTVVPFEDMATLAEKHLEQIRGVSPRGPYRLAGFSLGAVVALEIARRLEADGERVELLSLIEPTSPFHYLVRGRHRRLRAMWAAALPLTDKLRYTLSFARRLPEFVAQRLTREGRHAPHARDDLHLPEAPPRDDASATGVYHESQELPREEILRLVDEAMRAYRYVPYDGPAVLLRADRGRTRTLEWRDEEVLWRELVRGGLTSEVIAATRVHDELFRDPLAVAALAERLEHHLRRAGG